MSNRCVPEHAKVIEFMTIREIAKLAGVSRGTVDRVINGRGRVSDETKRRIEEVIKKTNFKPSALGKALATKSRGALLGIIINSVQNPFFEEVKRGIRAKAEELKEYGFKVRLEEVKGYDREERLSVVKKLSDCDMLALSAIEDEVLSGELVKTGKKIITLNSDADIKTKIAYVGCDYYQSGLMAGAVAALAAGKAVRAGIVIGSVKSLGHIKRAEGFERAVKESGATYERAFLIENEDDDEISERLVAEKIAESGDLDVVYFGAGGTEGGIKAIERSGRAIKVITCDLTDFIREKIKTGKVIASVTQQPYEQGAAAVETAFEYIYNGREPKKQIIIKNEIVMKYNAEV